MTINEIARLAGVSRATVSRYLNDGYVSEEKRQILQKVIKDTGYEPSKQAQNLRKKTTGLIGVIIPRIQSESVSRMVAGISSVLSKEGYQLLLANTQNDEKEELKYLRIFRNNQVDGVIFIGTIFTREHFRLMEELEVPLVVLGQQIQAWPCVYQDDYHAAYDLTARLLKQAFKIGYIGVTTLDKAVGEGRKQGFMDAVADIKPECQVEIRQAAVSALAGYDKARELLTKEPKTDTLFCVTDEIAAGALKYLHEAGYQVPEQVQLVGFGDTAMGKMVTPEISSVHFYYKTSGMEAAKLLLEILQEGRDIKKEIKMGYRLCICASLRAPTADNGSRTCKSGA